MKMLGKHIIHPHMHKTTTCFNIFIATACAKEGLCVVLCGFSLYGVRKRGSMCGSALALAQTRHRITHRPCFAQALGSSTKWGLCVVLCSRWFKPPTEPHIDRILRTP